MQIKNAPHTENVRSFNSRLVCIFAGMVLNDKQTDFSPATTHPRKAFSLPSIQEHPTIAQHPGTSNNLLRSLLSIQGTLQPTLLSLTFTREQRFTSLSNFATTDKLFNLKSTSADSDFNAESRIDICQTVAN